MGDDTMTVEAFDKLLTSFADRFVLVDFFADWCVACALISPEVDKMSDAFGSRLQVLKIDVDKSPDVAEACEVNVLPTFMLFHKTKKLDSVMGSNVDRLRNMLAAALAPDKAGNNVKKAKKARKPSRDRAAAKAAMR